MNAFAKARRAMITCQLRPDRIAQPSLLAAFDAIPRERCVPRHLRGRAYTDCVLALEERSADVGRRRSMLPPRATAHLLQALAIGSGERVLDLACATGYTTALMAYLVGETGSVVGVEGNADLAAQAQETLEALALPTARVHGGAPAEGAPDWAPYDAIVIDGGVERIPPAIVAQLTEGGRLSAIVLEGAMGDAASARLFVRRGEDLALERVICDAHAPLMPGFEAPARFVP